MAASPTVEPQASGTHSTPCALAIAAIFLHSLIPPAAIARTVRKRLGLSQAEFAARFHVPVGTLRDWEQNRRQPDAPALAYLRVIAREPEMVAKALVSA